LTRRASDVGHASSYRLHDYGSLRSEAGPEEHCLTDHIPSPLPGQPPLTDPGDPGHLTPPAAAILPCRRGPPGKDTADANDAGASIVPTLVVTTELCRRASPGA
jgi:hypothetical protein